MNLPNQLTVGRLVLTVFFVACLSIQFPLNHTLALAIFLVASLTDYLDGVIARRGGLITDFGKLMDPLADKVLTAAAFICLIPYGILYGAIAPWVVLILIAREFLITGLRLLAGAKGVVLPAEKLGKHKTGWQMATIIFFLLLLALDDWSPERTGWMPQAWHSIGTAMVAITTLLTVYSGGRYLWKNRRLIANT
jgi:CDP-diacylglycerol--glycerol-3-phosphate 3-phosphatidyltransferase